MSNHSDDSLENIDFGGRFARQFSDTNAHWTRLDCQDSTGLHLVLNPTSSTPAVSDNTSICDSGYDSFHVASTGSNSGNNQTSTPVTTHHLNNTINNASNTNNIIDNNNNNTNQTSANDISTIITNNNNNNNLNKTSISISNASASNNNTNNNNHHLHHDNTAQLIYYLTKPKPSTSPPTLTSAITSPLTSITSTVNTTPSNPWATRDLNLRLTNIDAIERAASLHRSAASYSEPQYTWSGQLRVRSYKNPVYSCKVFLGGVPWDITEAGLIETFGRFGPLRVQWPGNRENHRGNNRGGQENGRSGGSNSQTKAGYVYLIYESERYVKSLLKACTHEYGQSSHPEKYYYQLSSRRMRYKEVQVIPWMLADSNYIRNQFGKPELHRTVFVGALHGMLTAEGLSTIMNDLFGGVAYVGIDSDKHKYPIGSGRVTFINERSYLKAVSAAFIEVKSSQFSKKIQVDPYLESCECSTCHVQNGPIFCRACLRYFCKTCWNWHHSTETIVGKHQHHPLMRKKRDC